MPKDYAKIFGFDSPNLGGDAMSKIMAGSLGSGFSIEQQGTNEPVIKTSTGSGEETEKVYEHKITLVTEDGEVIEQTGEIVSFSFTLNNGVEDSTPEKSKAEIYEPKRRKFKDE